MDDCVILGIHVTGCEEHAAEAQKVLTEYGCNIKTRLGLHEVNENLCSSAGLILVEVFGGEFIADELIRKLESIGGIEVKKVPLPAVVTVDLRIVSPKAVRNGQTDPNHEYQDGPRYASLKGIMKAKKKPVDKKTPADLGVELNKRVVYHGYEAPPERAGGIKVKDVAELLDKLHNEAKVI